MTISIVEWLQSSIPNIRDIDQKIQDLQDDIAFLRRARKSRLLTGTIVAEFPEDLLCMIFGLISHDFDGTVSIVKNTLAVTQVCRRWRTAALDFPQMWSCIFSHKNQKIADLWLSRAGAITPLRIMTASEPYNSHESVQHILSQYASRLKEISLRPPTALDDLELQVPLLERLTLCGFRGPGYQISHLLSSGAASGASLRYLYSFNCSFSFNQPFFSRLRSLILRYPNPVPLPDMINALRRMEELEVLLLAHAVDKYEEEDPSLKIVLPRLTTLHIREQRISTLLILLRLIYSPTLNSFKAQVSGEHPPTDDVRELARLAYGLIPTTQPWKVCFDILLSPWSWAPVRMMVKVWPDSAKYPTQLPHDPPFTVTVSDSRSCQNAFTLSSLIPVSSTPVSLYFTNETFNSDTKVYTSLGPFFNHRPFEEVLVEEGSYPCFLELLGPSQDGLFFFPSLKHLRWIERDYTFCWDNAGLQLKEALRARRKIGLGLDTLRIFLNSSILEPGRHLAELQTFCTGKLDLQFVWSNRTPAVEEDFY